MGSEKIEPDKKGLDLKKPDSSTHTHHTQKVCEELFFFCQGQISHYKLLI